MRSNSSTVSKSPSTHMLGIKRPKERPQGDCCWGCNELQRVCVAHLHILKSNLQAQRRIAITLHANFQELRESARNGCHLCRCWAYALMSECMSPVSRHELSNSSTPIIALSPVAFASRLRSGIAEPRIAHFFKIQSKVEVEMRLGGVSNVEFQALMHREGEEPELSETAVKWLTECYSHHSTCALGSQIVLPTRLLDIRGPRPRVRDCSTLDRVQYVALSYCWGGDQDFKLTLETASALKRGIDVTLLSRTIQDAVKVCRKLDIGYLWVDALCIMQDENGDDWHTEAANIHRIYGNAYVTLSICSAESASDGFLNMEWPDMLPIDPRKATLANMLPNPCRKTLARIRTESPLAARGWIFQEELLSPRILYWSDQGLFWSCSSGEHAENGTADTKRDELFPHIMEPDILDPHEFWRTDDPLLLWDDMISAFSTRRFTIDEDRLPAVSGLATLIQQSTGDQYLLGLWKSRLPAQLLWIVTSPPRARRPDARLTSKAISGARRPPPPSWSWASIAPARKIVMPKQASTRAQLCSSSWQGLVLSLHLSGRARNLTTGLTRLSEYPDEVRAANNHLQVPSLQDRNNVWAVSKQKLKVLVCLEWRHPIIINLDNETPTDFSKLICFEINYIGLLLLEPLSAGTELMYRRIGCAQTHRESQFFAAAESRDITLI